MITISHRNLENSIVLQKEFPFFTIVVENQDFYYKLINDFVLCSIGEQSDFEFFHNGDNFEFLKHGVLINDLFQLNFNDKKNINALYKSLSFELQTSEHIEKFANINEKVAELLSLLTLNLSTPIDSDELDIISLFKAVNLRYDNNASTIVEKIINYIQVFANIKEVRFVVFVNLNLFLNNNDVETLINELSNNGIYSLFLEGRVLNRIRDNRGVVITYDGSEL